MVVEDVQVLNASDRCDRCGAQAHIKVDINGLDLLFCVHHYRKSADGLEKSGAKVIVRNDNDPALLWSEKSKV